MNKKHPPLKSLTGVEAESKKNAEMGRHQADEDMGQNGREPYEYKLDKRQSDALLAHAREDAAVTVCNTISLMKAADKIRARVEIIELTVGLILILEVCRAFGWIN